MLKSQRNMSTETMLVDINNKQYNITTLDMDSSAVDSCSESSPTIVVTASLAQAFELYGDDVLMAKRNLINLDSFVRDIEDHYLGERFDDPELLNKQLSIRIEESYLSTGFESAQAPEHTILELLQTLSAQDYNNPLDPEKVNEFGQVRYVKLRRLLLRKILFNNPFMDTINAQKQKASSVLWDEWIQRFLSDNEDLTALVKDRASIINRDEIIKKFDSFSAFVKAVNLMRSWMLDHKSSRQWSTMFLFPFGVNVLYSELDKTNTFKSNYLAGQGELIFCMLQRAYSHGACIDLGHSLCEIFFNPRDVINTYAGYLNKAAPELDDSHVLDEFKKAGSREGKSSVFFTSYLPYKNLPAFTRLAEDVSNLLKCQLNKQDLFIALGKIAVLNLMTYLLEQEQKMCICRDQLAIQPSNLSLPERLERIRSQLLSEEQNATIDQYDITLTTCAQDTTIKKIISISNRSFMKNSELFNQSRSAYVRNRCELYIAMTVPFLRSKPKLNENEARIVTNIIGAAFNYDPFEDQRKAEKAKDEKKQKAFEWNTTNCTSIIDSMIKKATTRDTHMDQLHKNMAESIGLCKGKLRSKKTDIHYEISDELLRVLVMAILGDTRFMKLSSFIDQLYSRYHIVIDNSQQASGDSNLRNHRTSYEDGIYENNLSQLKMQLHRMDMLICLSDYCDYIKNPCTNGI